MEENSRDLFYKEGVNDAFASSIKLMIVFFEELWSKQFQIRHTATKTDRHKLAAKSLYVCTCVFAHMQAALLQDTCT